MIIILILIFAIFSRYLLMSYFIDKKYKGALPIINLKKKKNQKKFEIKLSFYSSIMFALGLYHLFYLWVEGSLSLAINDYPWWYHPLSFILALLTHETYYYWLHRLMHTKNIYKIMHHGHHKSIVTSSWTAFSFDILETFFQVFAFYLIAFLIPLHPVTIIILLITMSISATINHLNHEIYPHFFHTRFPFNLFIGATHHALHHKEFKSNYGLYFTFWDKWMGTESKNFDQRKIGAKK